MLSSEQKDYIMKHLRRPENDADIAKIAYEIAQKHGKVSPDMAFVTATLMNLGETDPRIAGIYSVKGWSPEQIELNKKHGEYSVEMAESIGISLTDEQKQVISGHCRGEYVSELGQIIKIAEVCRATEQPRRWHNGVQKSVAKSWDEVESVLKEDEDLLPEMIEVAKKSYGKTRFKELARDVEDGEISE